MGPSTTRPEYLNPATLLPEELIFGKSAPMQELMDRASKIAGIPIPVLIEGPSGAGKEVLARYIHTQSPWRCGPFIKVTCPAIPAELLESELFGYERGAFTGAYDRKPGLVELAEGGTLFLDEIVELAPALQAKLLHLLQDGLVNRIGSLTHQRVSVRVICATNRPLEEEVENGSFRPDLLYRINVVTLRLSSLKERATDIPDMVGYFIDRFNREYSGAAPPLSSATTRLLMHHSWPGNIRELENLIKQYVVLNSEEVIVRAVLGRERLASKGPKQTFSLQQLCKEAVQDLERDIILRTLYANNWNRRETARLLQISYRSLFYKLNRWRLNEKPAVSPTGDASEENEI